MSEKQAKRIRELDRRISHLEAVKPSETDPEATDRWEQAILAARMERARAEMEAQYHRRAAREAREAADRVALWKWVTFCAIVTAIIVELLAIAAINCRAVEPPVSVEPMQVSNYTPAPQIVAQEPQSEPEEAENDLIEAALLSRAHVIKECEITHYCAEQYPHICGTGDGLTATGTKVTPYVSCAVDPRYIPYGSTVMVDFGDGDLHYYVADDCGGAIKGNHVDLCVSSHSEALALGTTKATVYWCKE